MAIGNGDFIEEINQLTGFDMCCKNRGRPRKQLTMSNDSL